MDGIGPDASVLGRHSNGNVISAILQGDIARAVHTRIGIRCICADCNIGHRRIHNQIIFLGIPVKAWRQIKSVHPEPGQLVVGASVSGRRHAGLLRHVVKYRDMELQGCLLHIRRICLGQPGRL